MPQCIREDVTIFYQLFGYGNTKVLLIPGIASTLEMWYPQVTALCGTSIPNEEAAQDQQEEGDGIQVCALDNRGVGNSSKPESKASYSTKIMAMDALAVVDKLGWENVHVVGHSMGGMIATKLHAMAPERIASACFLSVTGGGYECLPKLDRRVMSLMFRFLRANTPEKRALVDLETHYTQDYLEDEIDSVKRRVLLLQEYVRNSLASGMQPRHAFDGQAHACWTHSLTEKEIASIRAAGAPVLLVHGRGDIIAQIKHGRNLARKLQGVARLVELPGGHMVTHQHREEVNQALLDLIRSSESMATDLTAWAALRHPGPATGRGFLQNAQDQDREQDQEAEAEEGTCSATLAATAKTTWSKTMSFSRCSFLGEWRRLGFLWQAMSLSILAASVTLALALLLFSRHKSWRQVAVAV